MLDICYYVNSFVTTKFLLKPLFILGIQYIPSIIIIIII